MKQRTTNLAGGWAIHEHAALPGHATVAQRRSAEMAFYAGAAHVIGLLAVLRTGGGMTGEAWQVVETLLLEAQDRTLDVLKRARVTRGNA